MQEVLLKLGLPGVVILCLLTAVVYLWRVNQALNQRIDQLQESRLQDLQEQAETETERAQRLLALVRELRKISGASEH